MIWFDGLDGFYLIVWLGLVVNCVVFDLDLILGLVFCVFVLFSWLDLVVCIRGGFAVLWVLSVFDLVVMLGVFWMVFICDGLLFIVHFVDCVVGGSVLV